MYGSPFLCFCEVLLFDPALVCLFVGWLVGLTGYLLFGPILYYIYARNIPVQKKGKGGNRLIQHIPNFLVKVVMAVFTFLRVHLQ